MLDPEALLLATTSLGRDPRLFDEVLDWLNTNGQFINLQRLQNLGQRFGDLTVLRAMAAHLLKERHGSHVGRLYGGCSGVHNHHCTRYAHSPHDAPGDRNRYPGPRGTCVSMMHAGSMACFCSRWLPRPSRVGVPDRLRPHPTTRRPTPGERTDRSCRAAMRRRTLSGHWRENAKIVLPPTPTTGKYVARPWIIVSRYTAWRRGAGTRQGSGSRGSRARDLRHRGPALSRIGYLACS